MLTHFEPVHWNEIAAGEADPRDEIAATPWFTLACRFVDDWDMPSFDRSYEHLLPLEHFAPLIRRRNTGP